MSTFKGSREPNVPRRSLSSLFSSFFFASTTRLFRVLGKEVPRESERGVNFEKIKIKIDPRYQGEFGAWTWPDPLQRLSPRRKRLNINISEKVFEIRMFTYSHWLYLDLADLV